ncbi:MAG: NAD(P)-dependent oxidoreductase [Dehalococcoidales bacterium]|nr:NAD(P)-dependent oxidoreductase [Dehalococcoidales bacterium]
MSYLITGGTGFVGSYIARKLTRSGEKVIAYDLSPDTTVMDMIMSPEEKDSITIVRGDITDFSQLTRTVEENRVSRIIHLSSMLHPASNENPAMAERVNNQGQINVLECARVFDIRKIVWASSVVVFGPPEMYAEEYLPNDAPPAPVHVYGACKSFCEFVSNHYQTTWGVDHIGLRFTIVYGPGRTRGATSFVHKLMIEPALGKPSVVPYGDEVIDWQHVEDIASLVIKCSSMEPTRTHIFNTKFDIRSIREAKSYVESLIPEADITLEPGTFGIAWKLDDSLLQEEIGFVPEYPMEKGILSTINFFRQTAGLPPIEGKEQ